MRKWPHEYGESVKCLDGGSRPQYAVAMCIDGSMRKFKTVTPAEASMHGHSWDCQQHDEFCRLVAEELSRKAADLRKLLNPQGGNQENTRGKLERARKHARPSGTVEGIGGIDELKALLLSLQPQAQAQAQAQTSSPASHSSSRAHSSGGGRVQQLVAQNGAVRFDEKATVEVAEVGVPPALPPSLQVRHSSHAERHEAIQRMLADDANSD